MMTLLYRLADVAFVVFHSSLILFNIFGWIWKKTRLANLIVILITFASWFVLGLIVGVPGYCPLTDLHFDILEKLGHTDLPTSYIKYLADRITGLSFSQKLVDDVTLWGLVAAFAISLSLNGRRLVRKIRDKRQKTKV